MNLFGIMQALVSFVQDDNKDNLRSIVAGNHKLVFVCRGPLVFVSVSQTGQSETQVREGEKEAQVEIIGFVCRGLSVLVSVSHSLTCDVGWWKGGDLREGRRKGGNEMGGASVCVCCVTEGSQR